MTQTVRKPVAPFYAAAITWLCYAIFLPLYRPSHYVVAVVATLIVYGFAALLCHTGAKQAAHAQAAAAQEKTADKNAAQSSAQNDMDPAMVKMIDDGVKAIAEMRRLDENIEDAEISADIVKLENTSQKIFEYVRSHPDKLPSIRKFMDYYLPTTLKLLNAYDRMSNQGISGENIDTSLVKIRSMLGSIVTAFGKQLDSLFGDEALDISSDITVLETMMAREGLMGQELHATAVPNDTTDIKLQS